MKHYRLGLLVEPQNFDVNLPMTKWFFDICFNTKLFMKRTLLGLFICLKVEHSFIVKSATKKSTI